VTTNKIIFQEKQEGGSVLYLTKAKGVGYLPPIMVIVEDTVAISVDIIGDH
jgi:hypothetical protein